MPAFKPARFRRLMAWILDWSAVMLLPLSIVALLAQPYRMPPFLYFLFVAFGSIGCFACFLCRDWLLGGRSIGKRLLGLSVVDRQTGTPVTGGKLVLRNLFFFVYPVDGGFLLFSGRSLGEWATETAVVRSRVRCPIRPKPFLIVAAIVLAISLPLCGVISLVLGYVQSTESYQICYSYLVESDAFTAQGADADNVAITGFSQNTQILPQGSETSRAYTFQVEGATYIVTCHPQADGSWAVCGDCTNFN